MSTRLRLALATGVLVLATTLAVRGNPLSSAAAEIQLQLANLLFDDGRYKEAIEAFQRARQTEATELQRQASMGVVRSALRMAEFSLAAREALKLKRVAPRDPEALSLYGDSLWAAGLFDEGEQIFRDTIALDAESARGRHGLARAHATRSRLDAALDEAQAALRQAPRDSEIHHTVGAIYEQMHQYEAAASAYGNYVNLLPDKDRSEKAAWSRAEIKFLKAFGQKPPFVIAPDAATRLHTIPFRLVKDKVIVRGRVNRSPEMDFVLDTGSEQTVITQRTAQRLGVPQIVYTLSAGVGEGGLRGLQLGKLDTFEVGTLKIEQVPCLIKNPPLRGLPTRETESFSPLALGLSMVIDYRQRLLTIGKQIPVDADATALPLRMHRLAMIRGIVDKAHPASFVVDTGGEVISISSATARTLTRAGVTRHIPLKVYGTSGWDRDAFLLPGVNLAFQAIQFTNFPVVVLNLEAPSVLLGFQLGGIVGHRFLSRYRVGIDLERSELRLKPL